MTPTVLTKATTSLLGMACDAAGLLGASGVLILPEGPMDWEAIRATCPEGRLLVAVARATAGRGGHRGGFDCGRS